MITKYLVPRWYGCRVNAMPTLLEVDDRVTVTFHCMIIAVQVRNDK